MKRIRALATKNRLFIFNFFKDRSGSIIVMFAIMLPVIFLCFMVSLNNAYILKSRAQISEASNEASLAIIAVNNKNSSNKDLIENKRLALNYINYYLTKTIDDNANGATIDVEYKVSNMNHDYYVTYQQDITTIVKMNTLGTLGQSIAVGNKNESSGNTRKSSELLLSADIAFVADFSGSATCSYTNTACNQYSAGTSDQRRLNYMRNAIADLIDLYAQSPDVNFAFIPYDIGVPVANPQPNLAGGNSYSCSVLYKLKPPYNSLDYNFWANKNIFYTKWANLKSSGIIRDYLTFDYFAQYSNTIFYHLDYYYYLYYAKILGPALGYNNDNLLVNRGLCIKKHAVDSVNYGEYKYGCGTSKDDYPLKSSNSNIVTEQYATMVQLYDYMYSGKYNAHYSLANNETVDVAGTLDTLFSEMQQNTITFTRQLSPSMAEFTPFMAMCSSPIYSNKLMVGNDDKLSYDQLYKNSANNIKSFTSAPRLVPLSNNSQELSSYLKSNQWLPGGGTDTMTGLLRAVPVIAEGTEKHKIIIIVSDGKDDSGADVLRDNFLNQNACQVITNGLTSFDFAQQGYTAAAAKSATIHYIKLDPMVADIETDAEYEAVYGKWYTNCMSRDKQYLHVATDYESLLDISKYIIEKETETGTFIQR